MASSILMTIIAMMFGGIMEGTKQLEVIINKITKVVKKRTGTYCSNRGHLYCI